MEVWVYLYGTSQTSLRNEDKRYKQEKKSLKGFKFDLKSHMDTLVEAENANSTYRHKENDYYCKSIINPDSSRIYLKLLYIPTSRLDVFGDLIFIHEPKYYRARCQERQHLMW